MISGKTVDRQLTLDSLDFLGGLLLSGMRLLPALEALTGALVLGRRSHNRHARDMWKEVGNRVEGGATLSDALATSSVDSDIVRHVKRGETGGNLPTVLGSLGGDGSYDHIGVDIPPCVLFVNAMLTDAINKEVSCIAIGSQPPDNQKTDQTTAVAQNTPAYHIDHAADYPILEAGGDEPASRTKSVYYLNKRTWSQAMAPPTEMFPSIVRRIQAMAGLPYWSKSSGTAHMSLILPGKKVGVEISYDPDKEQLMLTLGASEKVQEA